MGSRGGGSRGGGSRDSESLRWWGLGVVGVQGSEDTGL